MGSRPAPAARVTARVWCTLGLLLGACSSPTVTAGEPEHPVQTDAPLVAAQPGAWFDAHGNLSVVGAGRRLRLVLSAPISACSSAFTQPGAAERIATLASLPFHILSEACREQHPDILLAEESETASPTELERSYHEVARCAATELGLAEGWYPQAIADADPCPLALGLGWRLPEIAELQGLTVDDRKAIAGALFDTEDRGVFGGLLLYAHGQSGITLVTISPNAAEQAPVLSQDKLRRPFFGAALRCVKDGGNTSQRASLPVLPHAAECLREQRKSQGLLASQVAAPPPAELKKLRAWLDAAETSPAHLRSEAQLRELNALLTSPALERLAREGREERALTERYAELAEGLDDPSVSPGERKRRHEEFDSLRRRLGGKIVQAVEAAGTGHTEADAILSRLLVLLEAAKNAKTQKKGHAVDYEPALSRIRALGGTAPK